MLIQPNGRPVIGHKSVRPIADPRLARIASTLEEPLRQLGLSLHCPHCNSGVVGRNHETDTTWTLECDCTVRRMSNPDARH